MGYKTKFFKRFNEALQKSALTLKELSEKTKIPLSTLRHYTTDRIPMARALYKLCIALHVSADYLLSIGEHNN